MKCSNVSIGGIACFLILIFLRVEGAATDDRFIPLAFPEVIAIAISGALTSVTGHYVRHHPLLQIQFHLLTETLFKQVPFMVLAVIVGAVGGDLLTHLGVDTPTVQWPAYLVIAGFGLGLGIQQPYSAVQEFLRYHTCPQLLPIH